MPVQFAGVDLLLEHGDGRVADWFDDYLPYSGIRNVAEYPAALWNSPLGITQPNWAQQLRPKLNTWYSPTGCSRWSHGFFLVDAVRKAQIVASGATGTLKLYDATIQFNGHTGSGQYIPNCVALPPHPVSANSTSPASLWIMPIVDQRYAYQYSTFQVNLPAITILPPFPTWSQVIQATLNALGIGSTPFPTPNSNYLVPNQWALTRQSWQSTAVMLDVILASVGMRLVPSNSSGSGYAIHDYTTALAINTSNFANDATPALQVGIYGSAALDLAPVAPAQVNVVFKAWQNGIKFEDDLVSRYSVVTRPSQVGYSALVATGPQHTIRSSALANYTANGFPSAYNAYLGNANAPDNLASLTSLAQQISADVYGWISWTSDQALPSISNRLQTGFDDYWEYYVDKPQSNGSRAMLSRVHTMPHNFSCDDLLHWDATITCNTVYLPTAVTAPTAGSGYGNGDVVTPSTGTQAVVTGVDASGAITALGLPQAAPYGSTFRPEYPTGPDAPPYSTPQPVTGGTGSGAQVSVTWTPQTFCNLIWEWGNTITGVLQGALSPFGTQYILVNGADVQFPAMYYLLVTEPNGASYTSGSTVTAIKDGGVWAVVSAGVPGIFAFCSTTTIVVATADGTKTGTFKTSGGLSVTAVVRRGICLTGVTYLVMTTPGGYEILNPSLKFRGKPGSTIATDATGSIVVWTGTGAGVASSTTVSGVRNDTSCSVILAKFAYPEWCDSLNGWAFDIFHST